MVAHLGIDRLSLAVARLQPDRHHLRRICPADRYFGYRFYYSFDGGCCCVTGTGVRSRTDIRPVHGYFDSFIGSAVKTTAMGRTHGRYPEGGFGTGECPPGIET